MAYQLELLERKRFLFSTVELILHYLLLLQIECRNSGFVFSWSRLNHNLIKSELIA